jgi:CheY-like chemotaxis protein
VVGQPEFHHMVTEAYQHLYDLAYLRHDRLSDLLLSAPSVDRKEKAWQLQRLLLNTIEELDPGAQVPTGSREWRRYRLMLLRYVEVAEPLAIAQQLAISIRQYYREHEAALRFLADILWSKLPDPQLVTDSRPSQPQSRLEALQLEALRIGSTSPYLDLLDVVAGTIPLLQKILDQHEITIQTDLPDNLPTISVDRHLFRQLLLGMLGHMVERAAPDTAVRLTATIEEGSVALSVVFNPPASVSDAEAQLWLPSLNEMTTLIKARLSLVQQGKTVNGFRIDLPTNHHTTILIVDDNVDILALYDRYLTPHGYRVVVAQSAQIAQKLAQQIKPNAIILDLMMPEQDGWDLLQFLLNQPETEHIPIVVCSVLNQKDLAFSLGVSAFLEKPITEQALLATLKTVIAKDRQ